MNLHPLAILAPADIETLAQVFFPNMRNNMGHDAHEHGAIVNCNNLPWLTLAPKIWVKLVKLNPEHGT